MKQSPKKSKAATNVAYWRQPNKKRQKIAAVRSQQALAVKKLVNHTDENVTGTSLRVTDRSIEELREMAKAECSRPLSGPISDVKLGLHPKYQRPSKEYVEVIAKQVERAELRGREDQLGD